MATAIQNVELGIVKYPLLSSLASRFPMSNQANANTARTDPRGAGSEATKPSLLYGENILPTSWGYTSVRADTVLMQKDLLGTAVAGEYPDIITEDKHTARKGKYQYQLIQITGVDLKQYMLLLEISFNKQADHTLKATATYRVYSQGYVPGSFDTWSVPYVYDLGVVAYVTNGADADWEASYVYPVPYISTAAPRKETLILISFRYLDSAGVDTVNGTLMSYTGNIATPLFTKDSAPFVDDYPVISTSTTPDEAIRTIAVSQGQLIGADAYNVYWSSISDYLDFKPSISTGAGSGTPAGLQGRIVAVCSVLQGIVVYSTSNIVKGRATGNSLYPYQFVEAETASGISHPRDVAVSQQNYANTSEGVVAISQTTDSAVNAELTEFITSKLYEYWDWDANKLVVEKLTSSVETRLVCIQDRYLVISYKRPDADYYDFAFIYDIVLKKFGKIAYPHLAVSTFNFDTEGELRPISDFAGAITKGTYHSYTSFPPYQFVSTRDGSDTPNARNNRIIALLGIYGELCVLSPSYNTASFNSLLVLGKFQTSKANTTTMYELTLDGIGYNTKIQAIGSYSGSTAADTIQEFVPNVKLADLPAGDTATFYGRITAKTFITAITGSFHITYGEAKLEVAGRR